MTSFKSLTTPQFTALEKSVAAFEAKGYDSISGLSDLYASRGWDVSAAENALKGDFGAFNRLPEHRRYALLSGNGPR
jgi:hypothetical protein